MSDVKLLAPEELSDEVGYEYENDLEDALIIYAERADATIRAACERLAQLELCPTCDPQRSKGPDDRNMRYNLRATGGCPDCNGTGLAHRDAMDALRKLGEER